MVRDGVGKEVISDGGDDVDINLGLDSLLIDPRNPSGGRASTIGKVFGGAWNQRPGTANYQFFVGGASAPAQNDTYRYSGAWTGQNCGRIIRETGGLFRCNNDPVVNCAGFRSTMPTGVAIGAGDSGGPIFDRRPDGRVGARGVISAGADPIPCGSHPTRDDTTCNRTAWGVGIHRLLNAWGVRIET